MMIKSLIIGGVAFVFLAWVMSACTSNKKNVGERGDKPRVIVSIPPQLFFVKNIAGDRVEVSSLLGGNTDAETFEPSVGQYRKLEDSDVYLSFDILPFERTVARQLRNNKRGVKVVDVSEGIDFLYDTHEHNHEHEGSAEHHVGAREADPHIWSSVVNAKIIALNTLNALVAADTVNEDVYRANYARLINRLDSADQSFRRIFAEPSAVKQFVVWHPSLSYFARDYGLQQISLADGGKESSVKGYASQLEKARDMGGAVYFYQKEFDSDRARSVSAQAGVRFVEINPLNEEWEDEIQKLYDAFTTDKP